MELRIRTAPPFIFIGTFRTLFLIAKVTGRIPAKRFANHHNNQIVLMITTNREINIDIFRNAASTRKRPIIAGSLKHFVELIQINGGAIRSDPINFNFIGHPLIIDENISDVLWILRRKFCFFPKEADPIEISAFFHFQFLAVSIKKKVCGIHSGVVASGKRKANSPI